MTSPLRSLIASGTKLWLDSIDPDLVQRNRALGATGATSNPIIVSDLIKTGRFDQDLIRFMRDGLKDDEVAWQLTDLLVRQAQKVFQPVWESTKGNDGYVSFELDPLLEDPAVNMPVAERTRKYIELGKKWSAGHKNRMIKVPATPGGLGALEELCRRRRHAQRDADLLANGNTRSPAMPSGAGPRSAPALSKFKSVYSIFVSRVDVYTEHHVPQLSPAAQGLVGIVNAKRIWKMNRDFWADKKLPLAAGNDLRQHRHQEAGGPRLEIRRGVRRHRHRDQPARDQRRRRKERPHHHPADRSDCRRQASWTRSTARRCAKSSKKR